MEFGTTAAVANMKPETVVLAAAMPVETTIVATLPAMCVRMVDKDMIAVLVTTMASVTIITMATTCTTSAAAGVATTTKRVLTNAQQTAGVKPRRVDKRRACYAFMRID